MSMNIEINLKNLYDEIIQLMAKNKAVKLNKDITKLYADLFAKAIERGYGMDVLTMDESAQEFERLKQMYLNQVEFAAAKQNRYIEDLKTAHKAFDVAEFKEWSEAYHFVQNKVWLEAEELMIEASAQMAERWHQMQTIDTLPNLEYVTVGDDHVRPEHQLLNGINLPMDDEFWDKYYPPNGYRCRCDVMQNDNETVTKKLPKIDKTAVPEAFQFNPGKSNRVVSDKHPYFSDIEKKELKKHCQEANQFYKKHG